MRVEIRSRPGLALIVEHDDGRLEITGIEYPSVGWGGGTAVVSPSKRYIAVVWDSGQSDAGYELYAFEPELRRIGGLARVYGSGAIVAFSPDERYLAMLSVVSPRLDADVDVDVDEEERSIEWAELRVQELPDGPIEVCSVTTTVPPIKEEGEESFYPEVLRFIDEEELEFAGPSGDLVAMDLPLPDSVEVDPPKF